MSETNINEIYQYVMSVVPVCGNIIRDAFYKEKTLKDKENYADLVTETDVKVEKVFTETMKKKYPNHRFIGEETTQSKVNFNNDPIWIIDPVDGTTNFVHKFPQCCLSIAFYENKQAKIGIVFNPMTEDLYSAIKGQGAYHNGKTIHPSGQKDLEKSQIIAEFGSSREASDLETKTMNMLNIISKVHSIRCIGSAALNACYIATGASDLYYEYGMHIWDIAASSLICSEAGCYVSDPSGCELNLRKRRYLVAATKELAMKFIPLLTHVDYESD